MEVLLNNKKAEDCSQHELLIRIDERTKHIPGLAKKVNRHDVAIAVLAVFVLFLTSQSFPLVAQAVASYFGR